MTPCIFTITVEPLRFSVVFHFGDFDKQAVLDFLNSENLDTAIVDGMPDSPSEGSNASNWRPTGWASSFVWVRAIPADREQEASLVHEVVHAIQWACHNRNISDDETEAYLVDYFYSTAMTNVDHWKLEHLAQ